MLGLAIRKPFSKIQINSDGTSSFPEVLGLTPWLMLLRNVLDQKPPELPSGQFSSASVLCFLLDARDLNLLLFYECTQNISSLFSNVVFIWRRECK